METALPPLLEHSTGLNHVAFGRDGACVAIADTALNVEIRDGETVRWSRSLATMTPKVRPMQRIRGLELAPDGKALFVVVSDLLLALDTRDGSEFWRYEPPRALGFLVVSPMSLAVRDDGVVAAAFDNGAIGLWSAEGEQLALWKDFDTQRQLAFLPDGRLVGNDSFGLSVFDVDARKRVIRTSLRDRAFGLATAPVSSPLAGRVAVRTLHETWQMTPSGEILGRSSVEPGLPLIAYHPTEEKLAMGAAHAVGIVDGSGAPVERIPVEDATVVSLAFSPAGQPVVGGSDRSLRVLGS